MDWYKSFGFNWIRRATLKTIVCHSARKHKNGLESHFPGHFRFEAVTSIRFETSISVKTDVINTGKSVLDRLYFFSLREPVAREVGIRLVPRFDFLVVLSQMPNTDSAKRALRKMERRRAKNRHERSTLRTSVKKVRTTAAAVPTGAAKLEDAKAVLQLAIKRLDQSAAKHLIHANKAARDKSRLMKLVNKLAAPAAPAAQ